MIIIKHILALIIGYLIGSIPWALIIGKVFYKKDIRLYGSGNLGGTNAGRVLGFKVGAIVVVLDSMKAFITMTICYFILPSAVPYIGVAVCVGHCFPLFAGFRGGKAVACSIGYVLALGIFVTHDWIFAFLYPLLILVIVLGLTKMMSLASISFMITSVIMAWLTYNNLICSLLVTLLAALVIYMHRSNIIKIINGKENKISFLK